MFSEEGDLTLQRLQTINGLFGNPYLTLPSYYYRGVDGRNGIPTCSSDSDMISWVLFLSDSVVPGRCPLLVESPTPVLEMVVQVVISRL